MLDDHAIVTRDGFKVPLLGIPPDAVLQECDGCHDEFPLREVELNDAGQCLCRKCRSSCVSAVDKKPDEA